VFFNEEMKKVGLDQWREWMGMIFWWWFWNLLWLVLISEISSGR
jgi:hypothetical protein